MKLTRIAAAILAFGAVTTASAADFTGFGVALDVQFKSTGGTGNNSETNTAKGEPVSESAKFSIGGEQDVIGGININFGFAVTPQVVLQVGATADLGKTTILKESYSDIYSEFVESGSADLKEKNHYSLYLAPGYLITPKTMIYAKLAYHSMKGELSTNYSKTDGDFESFKGRKSFKGYGLGVGIQTMMSDNIYAFAEVQRVQYGKETIKVEADATYSSSLEVKPRSTIGSIGVGYRF